LLYTLQDLPPSSAPAAIPTYLQYASQPHHEPAYNLDVSDFMTMIPGMSYANPHAQQGWMSSSSYADSDFFSTPAPIQPCAPVVPTPSAPAPQPQLQSQPVYVPATPTQLVAPPTQITQEFAIRTVPQAVMHTQQGFPQQPSGPFRRSQWELKEGFIQSMSETPFQTSIFRK
jgi:ubiquitin thioesterase protein OTUB1